MVGTGAMPSTASMCLSAGMATHHNSIQIITLGTPTEGQDVVFEIVGAGPPTGVPPTPPFTCAIKMNGWLISTPAAFWDDEEQVWRISFHLASGTRGSAISVYVAPLNGTTTASTTVIVM